MSSSHDLNAPSRHRSGLATRTAVIALLVVAGLGVVYWQFWSSPRYNVLLITLDTTRADHLGCYGYDQALTPTFDGLAQDGVVFERAFATVPLTLPSHTSILTGLYPPENGIHNNGRGQLDTKIPTLAEGFRRRGYNTGAFLGSIVLPAKTGLGQGFQVYDDDMAGGEHFGHESHLMRSARLVVDAAMNWLTKDRSRPFFCWIHLYDPHAPFEGHPEVFQNRFQGKVYDGDIAFTDLQVGRLIKHLKEKGEYDRTMIVVVGDHGESFGEHEEIEHGFMLYNTTLHVPLIMTHPGRCQKGHRVPTSVSLVDIFPTVMKCLNVPMSTRVSGIDLSPALQGLPVATRACYSESETCYAAFQWAPLRSITTDDWKYVNTTHDELYDLKSDPEELTNLADSQPEQLQEMRAILETARESMVDCQETDTPIDAKHMNQLSALGYLGTASKSAATNVTGEPLPDVKDMIKYYNGEFEARKLMRTAPDQAIEQLKQIIEATPDFLPARMTLATAYQALNRFDEAIDFYNETIRVKPDSADSHFDLAKLYQSRGDRAKAVEHYEAVLKIDPIYAMAHINLASIQMEQGEKDSARQHFKTGLKEFPESTVGLFNYGMFLFQQQELDSARRLLTRATLLDPKIPQIHYQLGMVLMALQHYRDAGTQFRETLRLSPRFQEAAEQLRVLEQRR